MCAEAVPWHCHRSLIADALTARGAHVEHITSAKRSTPHHVTEFAEVKRTRVTYPGEDSAGERLATRAPFHLEGTVRVLQRRPTNLVDVWEHEKYLRVLATNAGLALVEVANHGTIDDPDVRFTVLGGTPSAAARAALGQTVRRILGLDVDPEPLQRLAEAERTLAPTAFALRGRAGLGTTPRAKFNASRPRRGGASDRVCAPTYRRADASNGSLANRSPAVSRTSGLQSKRA